MIGRALAITEDEVPPRNWRSLSGSSKRRHLNLESLLRTHYDRVRRHVFTQQPLSPARELLIGALFSENMRSSPRRIFNPSIVPHPDQTAFRPGACVSS